MARAVFAELQRGWWSGRTKASLPAAGSKMSNVDEYWSKRSGSWEILPVELGSRTGAERKQLFHRYIIGVECARSPQLPFLAR